MKSRLPSKERLAIAKPLRELHDAVYAWFLANLNKEPVSSPRRHAEALAKAYVPGTISDKRLDEWAQHLASQILEAKPLPTWSKRRWNEHLPLALDKILITNINVARVLVAFERPHARCRHCKMTAAEGGGPMCECDK